MLNLVFLFAQITKKRRSNRRLQVMIDHQVALSSLSADCLYLCGAPSLTNEILKTLSDALCFKMYIEIL